MCSVCGVGQRPAEVAAAAAASAAARPANPMLLRLCEAFQSCMAEQGRVIDALYGQLSGRDATFRDQVLALVDVHKALAMESTVQAFLSSHGGHQAPHVLSAYLREVGRELGLRGVAASATDPNATMAVDKPAVLRAFRERFSVDEVAAALVADVNQQSPDAERVIDRDALAKWAAATAEATTGQEGGGGGGGSGAVFDAHSIYYDDERACDFAQLTVSKPNEANKYQPFLSPRVAMEILLLLFLGGGGDGGEGGEGGGVVATAAD